jgi:hypothetical protein
MGDDNWRSGYCIGTARGYARSRIEKHPHHPAAVRLAIVLNIAVAATPSSCSGGVGEMKDQAGRPIDLLTIKT